MTTVYAVTAGCYSDWRVQAIYAHRAQAEACAALLPRYDDAEVHEWSVIDAMPLVGWEQTGSFWVSEPGHDGIWHAEIRQTIVHDPAPTAVKIEDTSDLDLSIDRRLDRRHTLTVTGTDRERVAKTFSHWRARILAQPWTTMTADEVRAAIDAAA